MSEHVPPPPRIPDREPPSGAADPSSVLTISPWNSVAVATAELFEHAAVHDGAASLAEELVAELRRIDALVPEAAVFAADTHHGVLAEREIERSITELERTALVCRTLGAALRTAATAYGVAEQASERSLLWLTDLVAFGAGTLARLTMPSWLVPALAAAGGIAAGKAIVGALGLDDELAASWKHLGIQANPLYTDAAAVSGMRTIAMGADDFMAGFLGVPHTLQAALGDTGLGVLGLATAAGVLRGGSSALGTPETAPIVRADRPQPVAAAPSSITELVERIPRTDDNGGRQITIEQYTMPDGSARAVVLLAGTAEFTIGSDEPWDMGGNFSSVAGLDSSATMAIDEALLQAGVDAATPIQLVGFSQGGAHAAAIAMSGDYSVHSVVSFGAPIGQLPIPESIPVLAVRHPDDLVASGLGGNELHAANVFEVSNTAFAGQTVPTDKPAPAHQFDSYVRTAELMDADGSPELSAAINDMLAFAAGAVDGTSTTYLARRTPE